MDPTFGDFVIQQVEKFLDEVKNGVPVSNQDLQRAIFAELNLQLTEMQLAKTIDLVEFLRAFNTRW